MSPRSVSCFRSSSPEPDHLGQKAVFISGLSPQETSVPGTQTPTLPGGGKQPPGGEPGTGD